MRNTVLNLYHFEPQITTLGPGKRAGIWFQGCDRNCSGCLVPESHRRNGGNPFEVDMLVDTIISQTNIEGISISGGEPFLQQEELRTFLQRLKKIRPDLSVVLFTGFLLNELNTPQQKEVINYIDILIDGPFKKSKQLVDPWRGSENQTIHFLSTRYNKTDHIQAVSGVEFFIRSGGRIFLSGVPPQGLLARLKKVMANKFELQNVI